jgi:hypothetical protein
MMPKKPIVVEVRANFVYRFCGNDQGIPGLPHEVTREQAEILGLLDHLTAAIQSGVYKPAAAVSVTDGIGAEPKGE